MKALKPGLENNAIFLTQNVEVQTPDLYDRQKVLHFSGVCFPLCKMEIVLESLQIKSEWRLSDIMILMGPSPILGPQGASLPSLALTLDSWLSTLRAIALWPTLPVRITSCRPGEGGEPSLRMLSGNLASCFQSFCFNPIIPNIEKEALIEWGNITRSQLPVNYRDNFVKEFGNYLRFSREGFIEEMEFKVAWRQL